MKIGMIVVILAITNICCLAQNIYYKQYTLADGLPGMTAYEMVQDSNGILWIGTEKGLVSFNGDKFTTHAHPALNDNEIIKLALGKDGDIMFFNLSHQLAKVVDGKIQVLLTSNGVKNDIFSSSNTDYIITDESRNGIKINKIYELNDDSLSLFVELYTEPEVNKFSSQNPINTIYYSIEKDSLQLLKHKKRLDYGDSDNDLFNLIDFDANDYTTINQIYSTDFNQRKIALLDNNQFYIVEDEFFEKYDQKDVQRIVVYEDKYFIILHNRLDVYYPETSMSKVLINNIVVNTVYQDNENNLWVSTRNRGILKINHLKLDTRSFNHEAEIISGIYAVEDYILILWDDKIELRNKQNEYVFSYDFKTNKQTTVKAYNNIFFMSTWQIFSWIKPPDFKLQKSKNVSTTLKSMDFGNSYFYGGRAGVIYKFGHSAKADDLEFDFELLNRVSLAKTYALKYSESQKCFLAGTTSGIYRIDERDSISLLVKELEKSNISDIEESIDSSFWVATRANGIYRIKDEKIITHFNTTNGLLSNAINDLVVQDRYVYAATTNGVAQINIYTSEVVNKNSFNGLPSDAITNLCIFKDSIWMAIQKDVVVVDSTFFKYTNLPSVIFLEEFFCNNKKVKFKNHTKFNYDENKIDIILNNVSLSSGDNKSIKYRIANSDSLWVHSQESVIRLPALQSGKYHVEAIGINAVGVESETQNFWFEIKPPWWKTIWAQIVGVLLVIGIANSIIIIRGRRIRKEELLKRDYLSQINKIKDQALQLQMNPHFIFNSLNAIQGFIGTDDEEMAMNYLARFARLIRLIFEHSKGNTISLEEELEFINLYLDLEKLRFKEKVNVQISIDEELEGTKDIINVPPLLIQPIVENSFKHGLFHKKGKGNLKIDYSRKAEILQVVIQDDGIGREMARKIGQKNTEKHVSSGVKTTQERIELLNFGKKNKVNTIQIEDLYCEDGSAIGTKTILHLAINHD